MAEASGQFSCSSCGKQYKWKPEFAGRKVKCKCGFVMTAPAEAPAPQEEEDLYAFADDKPTPPATPQPVAAIPVSLAASNAAVAMPRPVMPVMPTMPVAALAGVPAASMATKGRKPSTPVLGYMGPGKPAEQAEVEVARNEAWREYYVPAGLVIAGIFLSVINQMYFDIFTVPLTFALPIVGVKLVVDLVMLVIGCFIAMKIMDMAFGAPGSAILKLCAVAVAPGALANICTSLFGIGGGMLGWLLAVIMYWGLLYWLFDLDFAELCVLTTIIWLIRTWAGMIIAGLILSLLFGAMSRGGGAGGGGFTPSGGPSGPGTTITAPGGGVTGNGGNGSVESDPDD